MKNFILGLILTVTSVIIPTYAEDENALHSPYSVALDFATYYFTGESEKAFLLTAYSTNRNDPKYNEKRKMFIESSEDAFNQAIKGPNPLQNISLIEDDDFTSYNTKIVKLLLKYADGEDDIAVVVMTLLDGEWLVNSFNTH